MSELLEKTVHCWLSSRQLLPARRHPPICVPMSWFLDFFHSYAEDFRMFQNWRLLSVNLYSMKHILLCTIERMRSFLWLLPVLLLPEHPALPPPLFLCFLPSCPDWVMLIDSVNGRLLLNITALDSVACMIFICEPYLPNNKSGHKTVGLWGVRPC